MTLAGPCPAPRRRSTYRSSVALGFGSVPLSSRGCGGPRSLADFLEDATDLPGVVRSPRLGPDCLHHPDAPADGGDLLVRDLDDADEIVAPLRPQERLHIGEAEGDRALRQLGHDVRPVNVACRRRA
jgi:hypothetical protein